MLTAEVTQKLESLSQDDYNMVVMLINRLAESPSSRLRNMREKILEKKPMAMEEIDKEIQQYRKGYMSGICFKIRTNGML